MTTSSDGFYRAAMEHWMNRALEQAKQAAREGEIPIGAVAVLNDQLVAEDHNRSIQLNDPSAHAEIQVLRAAGRELGNYRLNNVQMYVTVEPCPMCAGALIWARISLLVFGARDSKSGAIISKTQLLKPGLFNHSMKIFEGILAPQCRQLLSDFFVGKREK